MSPEEQLAEIKAKSNVLRAAQMREVSGGFIINTSTSYVDPATGGVLATQNGEMVATSTTDAIAAITQLLA